MKILIIAHSSLIAAGAGRSLLKTAQLLDAEPDVEVTIVVPWAGEFVDSCRDAGLDCRLVKHIAWTYSGCFSFYSMAKCIARNLLSSVRLFFISKNEGFDLVYSNTVTVFVGSIVSFLTGKPHVWHLREFAGGDQLHRFMFGESLSRWFLNRPNNFCICSSQSLSTFYKSRYATTRISAIYNPMVGPSVPRTVPRKPQPRNIVKLVIVGAVVPHKGQIDAVKATLRLRKKRVPAKLYVVGPSLEEYQKELQNEVIQAGEIGVDSVEFVGPVYDVSPYFREADMALMCSEAEPFGRVTVEAIMEGAPVVGTRNAGTLEILGENERGRLYSPGDSEGLAEAIQENLDDWEGALDRASAAFDWVIENCTEEGYKEAVLSQFRGVLSIQSAR